MTSRELLYKSAGELGVVLTDEQIDKFFVYLEELKTWNKKINLTSITEDKDIITRHFVDSLTVYKYLKKDTKLIDIGTGAGIPGIPLAIADSSYTVHMLDSRMKRIHFVKHIIRTLKLNNAFIYKGRTEEKLNEVKRGTYDFTISRAYSDIKNIVYATTDYLKSGGYMIIMKGESGIREFENARNIIESRLLIRDVSEVTLPYSDLKRVIIVLLKR